jgi:hypothetical protein
MPVCDACGTTIMFGGVKKDGLRFCNGVCAGRGEWLLAARQIPDAEVDRRAREVHQGSCPKCGGPGPVDVYTSHTVWSALVLTRWASRPEVCCWSCGRGKQLTAALSSAVLGWWGFPWGLILTPVQVGRNLAGLLNSPDSGAPSPALSKMVRLSVARGQDQTAAEKP